jgi:hypothetical protein
MGSVTIEQWRSSIGSFIGGGIRASRLRSKDVHGLHVKGSASRIILAAMLLVYGNITQMLLVKAGVEINPGPITNKNTGNFTAVYYLNQMYSR